MIYSGRPVVPCSSFWPLACPTKLGYSPLITSDWSRAECTNSTRETQKTAEKKQRFSSTSHGKSRSTCCISIRDQTGGAGGCAGKRRRNFLKWIFKILGVRPKEFVDTVGMIENAMRRFVRKAFEAKEAEEAERLAVGSEVPQLGSKWIRYWCKTKKKTQTKRLLGEATFLEYLLENHSFLVLFCRGAT